MHSPQPPRLLLQAAAALLLAAPLPLAASADEAATSLRVATAQIPVTRDIDANVAAIERAMDKAIEQQADILLTPEGLPL